MGYILYITFSLSLSLGSWHSGHGRQFCPVTDNYMLVQYGVLGPAAGIELQLTWRILVPSLAPVGLSKATTAATAATTTKGEKKKLH